MVVGNNTRLIGMKNHAIFVKVCVEKVHSGNRPHTHFNKVRVGKFDQEF